MGFLVQLQPHLADRPIEGTIREDVEESVLFSNNFKSGEEPRVQYITQDINENHLND